MSALTNLTIAVLAGGKGERMGGAVKPLLRTKDGITIVEAIARELSELGEVVLVAPAALVDPLARASGLRVVVDRGLGPGTALVEVARATASEWLLAVGGDQPRPSRALARRFLGEASAEVDVVRAAIGGVPQPIPALYRTRAIASTPIDPARGVALYTIAGALRARVIDERVLDAEERAAFLDADTPEDADRLELATAPLALDPGETG